jgi:integrase
MAALTQAAIAAAQPGDILRDDQVRGLHLTVTPKRRSFYLFFRTKDGTQRKPKIGDAGLLTLAQARKIAKDMLLQVANGRDPIAERQVRRDAPTVNELADRYWERHAKSLKAYRDTERHLNAHIRPLLGSKRVVDIVYADCERLHDRLAKTAPVQANRLIATFSKMLSLAEKWDMRPIGSNPCRRVDHTPERRRRRYMRGEEPQKIAAALAKHAQSAPHSVAFIYLLILSGARKGEIAKATWTDLQGNVLRLAESKTGPRDIFLPPQVMDIIDTLPRTVNAKGEPCGTIVGIQDPTKVWQQVRKDAGCQDLRLHDLRRSFASAALSAGLTLAQVGELLGHRNSQTTKGYAYLMEEAATAAVTVAADRLVKMMQQPEPEQPKQPRASPQQ